MIILARREHRAPAAVARIENLALPLFESGKISHAADGFGEGAGLDQKFAYFLEKIVEMIRLERVRKAFLLEDRLRVFRGEHGNEK